MPARRLTATLVTAAAVLLGACGGEGTPEPAGAGAGAGAASTLPSLDSAQAPVTAPAPAGAPDAGKSVLPDLTVDDVGAGTKVNLASLAPAPEPLLVWFWAPH